LWWSAHSGQILVDGLAMGTNQYDFCVANLRGPHRPRLTLNRSAIMPHEGPMPEWDKGFVDVALAQGAQHLRDWPGFTLAWFWRVAQANWRLAERLLEDLCLEDCRVRIGNQQRDDAAVSLRKIGCFGGDQVLLDALSNTHVLHYEPDMCHGLVPEWLVPWRLALWESEGVRIADRVWRSVGRPKVGNRVPRLTPGDSLVLSKSLGQRDWLAGDVPMSHLIRAAAKMDESITDIMARLERFAPFGLSLPSIHGLGLDSFSVDADDIIRLSRTCHEGGVCLDDRASAAHIIRVAARLERPLHAVIDRFREYERLGIKVPVLAVSGGDLAGIAVRREYLALLSEDLNEGGISLDDEVPPVHLVYIAGKSKRSIAEVITDLASFAVVGLRLPEVIDRTQLDFLPTEDHLLALSQRVDGQTPLSDPRISSSHILRIAFKLDRPVAAILADLKRLAPLGVRTPEGDMSCVGGLTVTAEDAMAMSQNLSTWGLSIGDTVPGMHLFAVADKLREPLENTHRRLSRFRCLGLQLRDVDLHKAGSIKVINLDDQVVLSLNCDGHWPWLDGVVAREHVLRAAEAVFKSPVEVVERLRSFECLGLRVPPGDPETWDQ
jgi:hypothetical protein